MPVCAWEEGGFPRHRSCRVSIKQRKQQEPRHRGGNPSRLQESPDPYDSYIHFFKTLPPS